METLTYLQGHDSNGCPLHTPASPTIAKKEEDGVGVLFDQQMEMLLELKMVCDNQSIKTIQITTSRNKCITKNYIHIYVVKYIFLLSKIVFILHKCL